MKFIITKVAEATVFIDGLVHSAIGRGLLVLVGITSGDEPSDA